MTKIDSAKPVTFYLKGIAIAAVVINHYINDFLPGEFGGYASGIITVFSFSAAMAFTIFLRKMYRRASLQGN